MASKCRCCASPARETQNHIFFRSELAVREWNKLSNIMDVPPAKGPYSLKTYWFTARKKPSLLEALRGALAAGLLWDLWMNRNKRMHGQPPVGISMSRWAQLARQCLPDQHTPSLRGTLILSRLNLSSATRTCKRSIWRTWKPVSSGSTVNIAILRGETEVHTSILIRRPSGRFVLAYMQSFLSSANNLDDFQIVMEVSLRAAFLAHREALSIGALQGSHPVFLALEDENDSGAGSFNFKNINVWTRQTSVKRISGLENNVASVLAATERGRGLVKSIMDLGKTSRRALIGDQLQIPLISLPNP